jgi:MFS family permease
VRDVVRLLREERRARLFFVALTQSALGTGAAYVALLLVAYERFHSPWALSLVLLADLMPAMMLGPVFGAAADRWSRRSCVVLADVVRAAAFVGLWLVDDFTATVAFAALAGTGTGLFTPASLAGLPSLVKPERVPAATSLYGAISDLGFTAGPALAALVLLFTGPEELLLANGVTFALSAGILARLPFGAVAGTPAQGRVVPSLLREAWEGLKAVAAMRGVRVVLAGSAAALFFGGVFNVGELLFATEELDVSDAGYSALVAMFGLGFIMGSLTGSGGGPPELLRRRFLQGAFLMGFGFLLTGLAPTFAVALVTFTIAGLGNGMLLVHERVIVQDTVSDVLLGRTFGVKDALASWAFGTAFFAAGGLLTAIDARTLIVGVGVGGLIVSGLCAVALHREGLPGDRGEGSRPRAWGLRRRGRALSDLRGHEHSADVVGGHDSQATSLDHLD